MAKARIVGVLVGLIVSSSAWAQVQTKGPQRWPGRNELAAHFGYQSGIGGYSRGGNAPSGFKFLFDYGLRFHEMAWLNFGVGFVLGSGCSDNPNFNVYRCGGLSQGNTIEPSIGVKLKFPTPIPLVPYAKFTGTFVGIYNRFCSDNGFAVAGRVGGGANYFLLPNLGVGVEMGFTGGPGFYGGTSNRCGATYTSHVEFYAAYDFAIGGEFIF